MCKLVVQHVFARIYHAATLLYCTEVTASNNGCVLTNTSLNSLKVRKPSLETYYWEFPGLNTYKHSWLRLSCVNLVLDSALLDCDCMFSSHWSQLVPYLRWWAQLTVYSPRSITLQQTRLSNQTLPLQVNILIWVLLLCGDGVLG